MEKKRYNWNIEFFGMADVVIGSLGILWSLCGLIVALYLSITGGVLFAQTFSETSPIFVLLGLGFLGQVGMGILIIKVKPQVIILNLFLTPLVAITSTFTLFLGRGFKHFSLSEWFIFGLIVFYFSLHFWFFTRPKVKEQFK